jgi:hypothetical protein
MEKPSNNKSNEELMMEALSMSLYGRSMQNRCSILSNGRKQVLENAIKEMTGRKTAEEHETFKTTED